MATEKTRLMRILEAAHASSLVHFPQAIVIRRNGDAWGVCVVKEAATDVVAHAGGSTPEEAIDSLVTMLKDRIVNRIRAHESDADRDREHLNNLEGGES